MARPTRVVDLAGDELLPAWKTVIELDRAAISTGWTLVGGLMVYVWARAAGLTSPRSTDDADYVVDLQADTTSLPTIRARLRDLGFELVREFARPYRYRHTDGRVVDVMAADHLPRHLRSRLRLDRRETFQVAAGQQAIDRRELWRLDFSDGVRCEIGVPSVLGALVSKGAAHQADLRSDRDRHLQDAATLFAAAGDVSALDYGLLSSGDRRRLRVLVRELEDSAAPGWQLLAAEERAQGQQNCALIARAAAL